MLSELLCSFIREESKRKDRCFNGKWLTAWPWLQYHRRKQTSFCSICSSNQKQHHDSRATFIYKDETSDGFSSWNKGPERFNMHQLSDFHRQSKTNELLREKEKIPQLISDEECRKNRLRQQGLEAHFGTLKTLLRQGLAIRRQEDKEGNVYQFNKDKSQHNPGLKLLMTEDRFMSHSLLGEQQEMLVLKARRALNMELQSVKYYIVIVDEATDISKSEHMSLSVRHCNEEYEVKEDFIGIYECTEGVTTDSLFEYIKDILIRCQLDVIRLVGMTFDGAMTMKSLAKKIKSEMNESAIFIHCLAHCQELIFKDATKHCPALEDAQALCEDLYVIVGVSPKRVALFAKIQDEIDGDDVLRLQNLSRTRWTTRGAAGNVITLKHAELIATLKMISEDKNTDSKCKAKAKGLIIKLGTAKHMFNMFLMRDLAHILEMNSKNLQKNDVTAEEAMDCIHKIEIRLAEMRSSAQEFEKVIQS